MTITMYSTATCSFCRALERYLDQRGLSFTKRMIDNDDAAMADFLNMNEGHMGVPFTVIQNGNGNQIKIFGFNEAEFDRALEPEA